jgi:hypothetical protein
MKMNYKRSYRTMRSGTGNSTRSKSVYRRFIPDARPSTTVADRGTFWYKMWTGMRLRA